MLPRLPVSTNTQNTQPQYSIFVSDKKITLNTEIIISLIVLGTLLGVFIIGVIEKLFFSTRKEKQIDQ